MAAGHFLYWRSLRSSNDVDEIANRSRVDSRSRLLARWGRNDWLGKSIE